MRLRVIPAAADSSLGFRPGLDRVISLTVTLHRTRPNARDLGRVSNGSASGNEGSRDRGERISPDTIPIWAWVTPPPGFRLVREAA